MATFETIPTRLSNVQIELLKLYPHNVSENQLRDIRALLANYFAEKIDSEMDQIWENNNWDESTVESLKSAHLRTGVSK